MTSPQSHDFCVVSSHYNTWKSWYYFGSTSPKCHYNVCTTFKLLLFATQCS